MIVYPAHVEHLRADGFTEEQIRQVQQHCEAAEAASDFPRMGTGIKLNGAVRWCHQPLAEILDQLRPGVWVKKPVEGKHQPECPCCGENAKRAPDDEPTRILWDQLVQKLLVHGGCRVAWTGFEDFLEELLSRGHLFERPASFLAMPLNVCHANAAILWARDVENTRQMYGYALHEDDLWRRHGWCMKGGQLLETNIPVRKYFGIELSQAQSLDFWFSEFLCPRYPKPGPAAIRCLNMHPQVKALFIKTEKQRKAKRRRSIRALFAK